MVHAAGSLGEIVTNLVKVSSPLWFTMVSNLYTVTYYTAPVSPLSLAQSNTLGCTDNSKAHALCLQNWEKEVSYKTRREDYRTLDAE